MTGTAYGQPFGTVSGVLYEDPTGDEFPARITHVLTTPPSGMPEVTSARLGFRELAPNPDTGAMVDRPDGRASDGATRWAVAPAGRTFAVGDTVTLRRHPRHTDRFEVVVTGGGVGTLVARLRLVGTAPGTAGTFAVARLTTRSGGAWAGAGGDTPTSTDVWLVEPNGGILPDRTAGRAYIALDTGVSEAVSGTTRRLWVAIVPPGVLTNVACVAADGTQTSTVTPVGV